MSSKYEFEFVNVTDDQKIIWKLRSRLGQEWLGNFDVIGCTDDGDVHVDVNVVTPKNTVIPKNGWSLVRWKLNRHVINSVKQACKNPELVVAASA